MEQQRMFLGLGSNVGDRERNLARAVGLLGRTRGVQVLRRSSLYESQPVGPPQPDFLNAAVEVATTLEPVELLKRCKEIERELGRKPDAPRWGPRTIDVDLLLGEAIVAEPALQIPHLQLHRRAFALMPLCEIDPEVSHPILERRLTLMLEDLGDQGVRRVGEFYVET